MNHSPNALTHLLKLIAKVTNKTVKDRLKIEAYNWLLEHQNVGVGVGGMNFFCKFCLKIFDQPTDFKIVRLFRMNSRRRVNINLNTRYLY
jgi:hypothetical protein